jgi:hypothetical protein
MFLMIPSENWDHTQLYEVKSGSAQPGLEIPGWSYQFVQVRE